MSEQRGHDIVSLRCAVESVTGDESLSSLGPNDSLIRSGILSSLDLVRLVSALETAYGVSIPDQRVTIDGFDSLASIGRLLIDLDVPLELSEEPSDSNTQKSDWMVQALRRPMLVALVAIGTLLILDQLLFLLAQAPLRANYAEYAEHGERLYTANGGGVHDDMPWAMAQHAISNEHKNPDSQWIAVFGDSGTIASYLDANESMSAVMQQTLLQGSRTTRVFNLAWFGPLLAKDLMLLELAMDYPLDGVVLTLGELYLDSGMVSHWSDNFRHTSFNYSLLEEFSQRIPQEDRQPFEKSSLRLKSADMRHWGPVKRLWYRSMHLPRLSPWVKARFLDDLLPDYVITEPNISRHWTRGTRYLVENPALRRPPPLSDDKLDQDVVHMLRSVIHLLTDRGIKVLLYVEPYMPRSYQKRPESTATQRIAWQLGEESGALVMDATWGLDREEFLDSWLHYTVAGNQRIGEALAKVWDTGESMFLAPATTGR